MLILIVDDSATARALFKACVSGIADCKVIETNKWDEAVSLALEQKPNIIILDYNMPEKVGTEIAKIMQEKGVKASFVLMTANTQDSVVKEATALGFADIVEKPISAESVRQMLEKVA